MLLLSPWNKIFSWQSPYLFVQEGRPLVGDKLVVEVVVRSHFWDEALHLRGHVILDEPELDWIPAARHTALRHITTTFVMPACSSPYLPKLVTVLLAALNCLIYLTRLPVSAPPMTCCLVSTSS